MNVSEITVLEHYILAIALSLVRVLAIFMIVPIFSQESIPGAVRRLSLIHI